MNRVQELPAPEVSSEPLSPASEKPAFLGKPLGDRVFTGIVTLFGLTVLGVPALMVIELLRASTLSIGRFGLAFLTTSTWDPVHEQFGALAAALVAELAGLFSPLTARLVDRFPRRTTLTAGLVGTALGAALAAGSSGIGARARISASFDSWRPTTRWCSSSSSSASRRSTHFARTYQRPSQFASGWRHSPEASLASRAITSRTFWAVGSSRIDTSPGSSRSLSTGRRSRRILTAPVRCPSRQ